LTSQPSFFPLAYFESSKTLTTRGSRHISTSESAWLPSHAGESQGFANWHVCWIA
jgi:hypothetical protein